MNVAKKCRIPFPPLIHFVKSLTCRALSPFIQILVVTSLAGAAIPLGGAVAMVERISPRWLEQEFRHSVTAFGGVILILAVALVLVPG